MTMTITMTRTMFVGRHDASNVGHRQNGLDLSGVTSNQPRNASMNAEDLMVNHSAERKTIKRLVDLLPHELTQLITKTILSTVIIANIIITSFLVILFIIMLIQS